MPTRDWAVCFGKRRTGHNQSNRGTAAGPGALCKRRKEASDKFSWDSLHSRACANDPEMQYSSSSHSMTSPGPIQAWKREKQKISVTKVSPLIQTTWPPVTQKDYVCFCEPGNSCLSSLPS